MIPNKTETQIDSNLGGEEIPMSLDADATAHIMGVLTDLYANPSMAVLREYATNALDSHIEAGVDRPIEITLPTRTELILSIRDYGVGLSRDDIYAIYSRYGASTKRESNDLTGALGLGCKSGLTYTDQFTVIGVKDEVRTTVSVSRDEAGGGTMTVVSEEEAPFADNGVEILVPADDEYEFASEAEELFRFWDEGTVLVNGEAPKRFEGIQITDSITAVEGYGDDYIVMGNVPYATSFGISRISLVVKVPIGTVDFTPTREDLQDNKRNEAVKARIAQEFEANRGPALQTKVGEAPSKVEALSIYAKYKFLAPKAAITWSGEEVPKHFTHEDKTQLRSLREVRGGRGYGKASSREFSSAGSQEAIIGFWVTDYGNLNWNAGNRDMLDGYVAHLQSKGELPSGWTTNGTIITPKSEPPHADWLDPKRILSWPDIKQWSRQQNKGTYVGQGVVPATYPVWVKGDRKPFLPVADIDDSVPLFYVHPDEVSDFENEKLFEVYPTAMVIGLKKNRVKKFLRLFPTAKPVNEGVTAIARTWWKNLTVTEKKLLEWDGVKGVAAHFDPEDVKKVLDPELRQLIELVKTGGIDRHLLSYLDDVTVGEKDYADELDERYPLLACVDRYLMRRNQNNERFRAQAVDYVNQAYCKRVQES